MKFDGYRALAFENSKETRLVSRSQKDFIKLPQLNDALKSLPAEPAVIDSEITARDPKGKSSFHLLQASEIGEHRPPLVYYAFDLLSLDGAGLHKQPLVERRRKSSSRKLRANIRFSAELRCDKNKLIQLARQFELEGLIAKKPKAGRWSQASTDARNSHRHGTAKMPSINQHRLFEK